MQIFHIKIQLFYSHNPKGLNISRGYTPCHKPLVHNAHLSVIVMSHYDYGDFHF